MIYICDIPSNIVAATRAFISRGIPDATIGKVGSTGIFAVPNEKQIAYDSYVADIEAFLSATAQKEKVLGHAEGYPFPESYVPSFPVTLPSTVAHFKSAPPEATLKKILDQAADTEMEEVNSKGGNTYIRRDQREEEDQDY